MGDAPKVSVIIPAFNAAVTLPDTLHSLLKQEMPEWEAVVVDDGSTDATSEIAGDLGRNDSRIKVLASERSGVSAARNLGVAATVAPWLLFLDADDLITPDHLAKLTRAIERNPTCDAVYSGWARLTPAGVRTAELSRRDAGNIFPLLARTSAFPIHSCLVRRSVVVAAGGFDESFVTCEDWDLWQRIARSGCSFENIHEVVALYRMRERSLSLRAIQMLSDGLRVIENGHQADPRVSSPMAEFAQGLSSEHLGALKVNYLAWCAGLVIGSGQGNAADLLTQLGSEGEPAAEPTVIAEALFQAAPLPTSAATGDWLTLWPKLECAIVKFLDALESHCRANSLARRTLTILERLIARHVPSGTSIGRTHSLYLRVTEPIIDIRPPKQCERIYLQVAAEDTILGSIELPVCDGIVPSQVIADAIAADYAWQVLQMFLEKRIYPSLQLQHSEQRTAIFRDRVLLADNLPPGIALNDSSVRNRIDWTLFLQEAWGKPHWTAENFYDSDFASAPNEPLQMTDGLLSIEISDELTGFKVEGAEDIIVQLTIGGCPIGAMAISPQLQTLTAQRLLASFTTMTGFELCRAVVREALVGQSWADPMSLRERLHVGAAKQSSYYPNCQPGNGRAFLPRRSDGFNSGSVARRAALPTTTGLALDSAAAAAGEPRLVLPSNAERIKQFFYVPEILSYTPRGISEQRNQNNAIQPIGQEARQHDRVFFESIFARKADPWRYTSAYERLKYKQTLSLIPGERAQIGLEIACAEGHFTEQLARHLSSLRSVDISHVALERARKRCRALPHVRFDELDLVTDELGGPYDLIVCSEVLYYVGDIATLENVAAKFARSLRRRGRLILAHANLLVDESDRPGFDWDLPFGAKVIGEVVGRHLQLVREIWTPLYRLQAFERRSLYSSLRGQKPVREIFSEQPTLPPPQAAHQIKWGGGGHSPDLPPSGGTRLPVLMYHRVASGGSTATTRWRLSPEQFEQQLNYLRQNGYQTPTLRDWAVSARARKPLPGHAILLTFDDGYADFREFAEPLLKQYEFRATVFAVTDCVGKTNCWDRAYGQELPLMDWADLRDLQAAGFEIGSHSASHPALTALTPTKVVEEAARSREILSRILGTGVASFAYPYGDCDPVVKHLIGASGYTFGLTCRSGAARFSDDFLALPRIEITGDLSLSQFITAIHA